MATTMIATTKLNFPAMRKLGRIIREESNGKPIWGKVRLNYDTAKTAVAMNVKGNIYIMLKTRIMEVSTGRCVGEFGWANRYPIAEVIKQIEKIEVTPLINNDVLADRYLEDVSIARDEVFKPFKCACGKQAVVIRVLNQVCVPHCADCDAALIPCAHCGCAITGERHTHRDRTYCKSCYDQYFQKCDCCNTIKNKGDLYSAIENGNVKRICTSCIRTKGYRGCSVCSIYFIPVEGQTMCTKCEEQIKTRPIKPYNYKPAAKFMNSSHEKVRKIKETRHFGFELEVGKGPSRDGAKIVNQCFSFDEMNCKEDGSIPGYGFEVVSHPATLRWYIENKPKIGEMFSKLSDYGYHAYDCVDSYGNSEVGLHVHVSKNSASKLTWMKLDFIVNNHKSIFSKLARRDSTYSKMSKKKMKNCGINLNNDRYVALNFQNEHTAEFRLFRSTLNVHSFTAVILLCNFLVSYAESLSLKQAMDYRFVEEDLKKELATSSGDLWQYCNVCGIFDDQTREA